MKNLRLQSQALLGCLCVAACTDGRLHDVGSIDEAGAAGVVNVAAGGATAALGGQGGQPTWGGATFGVGGATTCIDCIEGGTSGKTSTASGGAGTGGSVSSAATGIAGQSIGTAGSAATAICPGFNATGGTLMTPPSNGFESDIAGWTTTGNRVEGISRKQESTNACAGSGYLVCSGATRLSSWDGPKLELLPYLVPGHQYQVALVARFDPGNAPPAAATLRLISARFCVDSNIATTYDHIQEQTTRTDWVRLSGLVTAELTGCAQLSSVAILVESDQLSTKYDIDLDDFQLWDVTTSGGGGGAGAGSGS